MGSSNGKDRFPTPEELEETRRNIFSKLDTYSDRLLKEYLVRNSWAIVTSRFRKKDDYILVREDGECNECYYNPSISKIYSEMKNKLGIENVLCNRISDLYGRDALGATIRSQIDENLIMEMDIYKHESHINANKICITHSKFKSLSIDPNNGKEISKPIIFINPNVQNFMGCYDVDTVEDNLDKLDDFILRGREYNKTLIQKVKEEFVNTN